MSPEPLTTLATAGLVLAGALAVISVAGAAMLLAARWADRRRGG